MTISLPKAAIPALSRLHPNAQGAVKLAGFWTDAIMKVLATDGIKEGGEEEDDTWVKGKDLVTDLYSDFNQHNGELSVLDIQLDSPRNRRLRHRAVHISLFMD